MNRNNTSGNYSGRLFELTGIAKSYCDLCSEASEFTKSEFTDRALDLLPRLYWHFFDLESDGVALGESDFFSSYVDETLYEEIRGRIASVMGGDDVFLDTFQEGMQYSDTPISASISEGMADMFQPLFNFVNIVKDSEGTQIEEAFMQCKEDFENYWSQVLCNVLKALNSIKYGNQTEDEYYD